MIYNIVLVSSVQQSDCFIFIFYIYICTHTLSFIYIYVLFIIIQLLSHVRLCHPMDASLQASLPFTISQGLVKFIPKESGMLSNYFILCRLLLLLPSIFPSVRVFSNQLALHTRRPKYWSFSISPTNEYSG